FSTTSLMFHRADGLDVVLFFNKGVREVDELPAQGEQINRLINQVRPWPARDLFPTLGIPSFSAGPAPPRRRTRFPATHPLRGGRSREPARRMGRRRRS